MRRAYTIGAPSIFVKKNGLGRYPEFRDQGVVGGSNPLSPTNDFVAFFQQFGGTHPSTVNWILELTLEPKKQNSISHAGGICRARTLERHEAAVG